MFSEPYDILHSESCLFTIKFQEYRSITKCTHLIGKTDDGIGQCIASVSGGRSSYQFFNLCIVDLCQYQLLMVWIIDINTVHMQLKAGTIFSVVPMG